jgi:YfiH family protein
MLKNSFSANWTAPISVKTLITARLGGISQPPYNTLNLATHVGDDMLDVIKNREILSEYLPCAPAWLNQTHSDKLVCLDNMPEGSIDIDADASFTTQKNKVCVVMSADCIPVLLTNKSASFAAAVHAGWRGVENNIIRKTIEASGTSTSDLMAYIAPSICQRHFEVGSEVFEQFVRLDHDNKHFFTAIGNDKFNGDLVGIAKLQMLKLGLPESNIYLSGLCTYCREDLFYSYRKDGVTGRIASLIWLS